MQQLCPSCAPDTRTDYTAQACGSLLSSVAACAPYRYSLPLQPAPACLHLCPSHLRVPLQLHRTESQQQTYKPHHKLQRTAWSQLPATDVLHHNTSAPNTSHTQQPPANTTFTLTAHAHAVACCASTCIILRCACAQQHAQQHHAQQSYSKASTHYLPEELWTHR